MGLWRLILPAMMLFSLALGSTNLASAEDARAPSRAEKRMFNLALEAFDREDYRKSRSILLTLLGKRPFNGLYWFNLGNAEIKLKLWRPAMRSYERVVKLKSPLAGAAGIYLSKAARADGKIDLALRWMKWVKKRSFPPNLEQVARDEAALVQAEFMSQGLAAYDAQSFPRAIANFEKVLEVDGDPQLASQAEMMKGLALLGEDKSDEAHAQFESLMKGGSPVPGVQEYVKYFSNIGQSHLALDPAYWLTTDFAVTYNSNLFADGDQDSAVGRAVFPWLVGGGVRVLKSGLYALSIGDTLSGEEVPGLPSSRYFKNSFFSLLKYQSPGWQVQTLLQMDYSVLGSTPYAIKPFLSVSGQRVKDLERVGLTLQVGHYFPQSDVFSDVEGNSWMMKAFWIHRFPIGAGGPYFFISRENAGNLDLTTGTLPLGYTGFGPGFSGYLTPIQGWEFSGSASYSLRLYSDASRPSGLERTDRTFELFLRAARRISRDFSPYISIDAAVNDSTFGLTAPTNKNYGQVIVATGVSWDLL